MLRRGHALFTALAAGAIITGWALWFDSDLSQPRSDILKPEASTSGQSLFSRTANEVTLADKKQHKGSSVSAKRFLLNADTRIRFDRFIFEHEGRAPASLKELYATQVEKQQYEPKSSAYLTDLFNRYINYKVQLKALDAPVSSTDIRAMTYRLQSKQDLQHTLFTQQEYRHFFSQDAAYDNAALERLQIAADQVLSGKQKSDFIEEQLNSLPDSQKKSFQPSINVNRLSELQRTYDSPEVCYQAVSAEFGHDVARRLNKSADDQSQWQEKVKSFRRWRNNLMRSDALSEDQVEAQVSQKKASMFTKTEQRRLQVYLENPALLEEGGS
ncbi:lipase secretion chaperone [Salinimonas iocasae]|uniref:Lipase chaperone n=1 Tax=Salinimonas iocasae TaxID=2572577 RepID=A0A5B7YDP6_9ALTE|nr:lipase secretion chaperone [Salinimonas iocasae]QCZ93734.1 lipase chaperone [Salinimonas iocasae]